VGKDGLEKFELGRGPMPANRAAVTESPEIYVSAATKSATMESANTTSTIKMR
jgi:hypothetical protein